MSEKTGFGVSLKCVLFVQAIIAAGCFDVFAGIKQPAVPYSRTDNVKEIIFGKEIADPYRWLEDGQSSETREWIKKENKYTQSIIGSLPGRKQLKKEITDLVRIDWQGAPIVCNGRYFFRKRSAKQEVPVIYFRKGLKGKDVVLIDPASMSSDKTTSVRITDISKDGSLMAYSVQEGGRDEVTIRFLDVDKKKDLTDFLPRGRYTGFSLKPDGSGCFYVRHNEAGPRVYYHKIGAESGKDELIFGSGYGPDKIIDAGVSEDGNYLLITVLHGSAALKTEVYYQNLASSGSILPVVNDVNARFFGQIADDKLFMQTDWEAPNGRILCVDLNNPGREHWREIVKQSDAVIEDVSLVGGRLFVNYMYNVSSRLSVFEPSGKYITDIQLPAIGSASVPSGSWDSNEAFYSFSSFYIAPVVYRYDVKQGSKDIWWRANIPIKTDKLEVEQVWYKSKDETKVPMFVVHAKGIKLNGENPTLLTGYGGFGVSLTPDFSATAALWVQSGGVFAQPSLRGGGEFGENWHKGGMLANKQNVFDDFISAAQWLIDNGYTSSDRLAILGGSNGGLLVGAAITQKPELFKAAICVYPLLDMLRYQKFLVGRFWVSEYGSSDNEEQFKYLYKYSPYHNVKQGVKYPTVLFITGDLDTRVDPLHARKMTALLQSVSEPNRPVMLKYFTKAGHSGGQPASEKINYLTDEFSFLFWQLGLALK